MIPKVSVIVPVYNVKPYLEKSLNSLKNQTLRNIEMICIDDGSTDNSLAILKEYAEKDNRFKVFNQKNRGAGATRNIGIGYASGEYIAFLDPDDWICPDTLELLYQQAIEQNCDMVVYNYQKVDEKSGDIIQKISIPDNLCGIFSLDNKIIFNWKDIKSKVFGGLFYAAWNKLYKHSLLEKNDIKFSDCSMSEDNAFVFDATLNAERIGYNDKAMYNYLMRSDSAVHCINDRNFCIFSVVDSVIQVLKKCGLEKDLSKEFDEYLADTMLYHYKRVKSRDKYANTCKERFSQEQNEMIQKNLNGQNVVFATLSEIIGMLQTKKQ